MTPFDTQAPRRERGHDDKTIPRPEYGTPRGTSPHTRTHAHAQERNKPFRGAHPLTPIINIINIINITNKLNLTASTGLPRPS